MWQHTIVLINPINENAIVLIMLVNKWIQSSFNSLYDFSGSFDEANVIKSDWESLGILSPPLSSTTPLFMTAVVHLKLLKYASARSCRPHGQQLLESLYHSGIGEMLYIYGL